MKAVILAAGQGKRQRVNGDCKPLISVLGLSLIERVILTAKKTGIKEFQIIIGYNGLKIRNHLGDGSRYGVKINYVFNEEWKKGNGISLLKAKNYINEPFILLMADHLFDEEILNSLKEINLEDGECILCTDRNHNKYLDIEDATKVLIENDKIIDIGKELTIYNGVDTGIFLCSPSIFDALEESINNGNDTLSGGIRVLADRGKMRTLDVSGKFWIDVDDTKALKNAQSLLCRQLVKKTDGPVSKVLNRHISILISRFLLKKNITPNQISVISFIMSIIGAAFLSMGRYVSFVAGGVLVQLSSIIDGCDGEIARLKFKTSQFGAWFDAVLDRYADALIILGMVYGFWLFHHNVIIWIVGFLALMGSLINSYTADKYDVIFRRTITTKKWKIRFGRDIRLFIIFIGALSNQIFITLVILSILTNFESIRRIIVLKNKYTNSFVEKWIDLKPSSLKSEQLLPGLKFQKTQHIQRTRRNGY